MVVDAGLSLQPKRKARSQDETAQRRVKAELLLTSLAEADAVAFGADDWAMGSAWLREQVAAQGVPLLAANLVCDGARPYPSSKIVEAAGRRIAVVGITDGAVDGCVVEPPGPALQQAVAEVSSVDATVALVPLGHDREVGPLLEGVEGISVAIDATGRYSAHGPEKFGSTWSFGSGSRGKTLGVMQLAFVPGATAWAPVGVVDGLRERLDKLVTRRDNLKVRIEAEADPKRKQAFARQLPRLEEEVAEVRAQLDGVDAADGTHQLRPDDRDLDRSIADHSGYLAKVEAINESISGGPTGGPPVVRRKAPDDSPFVGAEVCSACHADQSMQWSTTPHAKALSTLAADNHAADAACVRCHVTGWDAPGGPTTPLEVGGFRDVQCEACHGAGRAHVQAPYEVDLVVTPPEAHCKTCHNEEQDNGDFDYATYLPKVDHGIDVSEAPGSKGKGKAKGKAKSP